MNINDLAKEITNQLNNYSEEIDDKMQKEIDLVAQKAVSSLTNNPNIPKKTEEYIKGFYIKKLAQGRGFKKLVIANKKYQITHLLEHGHITKTGGRTKAYPHWQQAQEIADTLEIRMKNIIKN